MELKTNFNVGDLVWYKWEKNVNSLRLARCEIQAIVVTRGSWTYSLKTYGWDGKFEAKEEDVASTASYFNN